MTKTPFTPLILITDRVTPFAQIEESTRFPLSNYTNNLRKQNQLLIPVDRKLESMNSKKPMAELKSNLSAGQNLRRKLGRRPSMGNDAHAKMVTGGSFAVGRLSIPEGINGLTEPFQSTNDN